MNKRKIDWESIEGAFRTGDKTIRSIAAEHGITDTAIRKRAKAHGWERDLSDQVRKEVRAKLVRAEVRANKPDKEIISEVVENRVELIRRHQKRLAKAHSIAEAMLSELQEISAKRAEIEQAIYDETSGDESGKRRDMMLRAIGLPSRAGTLANLANTFKTIITLERQAFCIDDGEGDQEKGQVTRIERTIVYPQNFDAAA